MQRIIKKINNEETSILTWGNPFATNGEDIIFCVPGNPGISDFYIEFASSLHSYTFLPVCVMNHAGFEVISSKSNNLKNQEHLFNLEEQVQHKLELIYNHLDKKSKIHIIGHSIGAWMIVELCDKNEEIIQRLSSVNLLFPTIQYMSQSRNGWIVNNICRRFSIFILLLSIFLNFLPKFIMDNIIKLSLNIQSIPCVRIEMFYKAIHPNVIKQLLFLAFNEMDAVMDLNVQGMEKIKFMTNVIYGFHDNWVPSEHIDKLKIFQPHLQLQGVNVDHSFVLRSSEKMARMVSDFINMKRSEK